MKSIILLTTLLLASLGAAPSPSITKRAMDNTVFVDWDGKDKNGEVTGSFCSGFAVGVVHVITAEHCVPQGNEEVRVNGVPVRVVKKNELFALLEVPVAQPSLMTISKENAIVTDAVAVIGFAYGEKPLAVLQRFVARNVAGDIFLDGNIAPGMSGGPVINEKGQVVGLTQASNSVFGIACGAKEIRDFLK